MNWTVWVVAALALLGAVVPKGSGTGKAAAQTSAARPSSTEAAAPAIAAQVGTGKIVRLSGGATANITVNRVRYAANGTLDNDLAIVDITITNTGTRRFRTARIR